MIDVFIKYGRDKPLADKNSKTVLNGFIRILIQSKRKPSKLWVNRGEFYNNLLQKWLNNNDVSMYSTYNEGKPVVFQRIYKNFEW